MLIILIWGNIAGNDRKLELCCGDDFFYFLLARPLTQMMFTFLWCGGFYSVYVMKVYKTHGHPDSVKGLVPRRQETMASGPADRIFLHTLCKSMHLLYLKLYTFSCNFSVQGFFLMKSKVCLFSDSL